MYITFIHIYILHLYIYTYIYICMLFVLPSTWHRMHPSPISPWLGSHFPLAAVAAVARCWWSILDIFLHDWPWWWSNRSLIKGLLVVLEREKRSEQTKYILTIPNYKYWEHFVLLSWPISGSLKWPTLDRPLYCDIRGNRTGIWTFDFGMFNEYMAGIQWSTIDLYWDWHGAGIESIEAFVIPTNTSTLPIDIPRAHDLHGPHYLRTVRTSVSMMSCPSTTDGFYMVSWCLNVENPTLHTPIAFPCRPQSQLLAPTRSSGNGQHGTSIHHNTCTTGCAHLVFGGSDLRHKKRAVEFVAACDPILHGWCLVWFTRWQINMTLPDRGWTTSFHYKLVIFRVYVNIC